MSTVKYAPGAGVALVGRCTFALLQLPSDAPLVEALWSGVQDDRPLDELLDILLANGLRGLPSFAILRRDDAASCHVVLRGGARLAVGADIEQEYLAADGYVTWKEVRLPVDPEHAVLMLPSDGMDLRSLPGGPGIVLASRLEVALSDVLDPSPPPPAPVMPIVPAAIDVESHPEADPEAAPEVVEPGLEAEADVDPEAELQPEVEPGAQVPLSTASDNTLTFSAAENLPEATAAPVREVPAPEGPSYDFLFEATAQRPAELAPAVVPAQPVARPTAIPTPTATPTPAPASEPPPRLPATSGLISFVPFGAASSPAPNVPPAWAPTPTPSSLSGQETDEADERTIKRSDLQAALRLQAAAVDRVGPMVHAVSCPDGHLNDPQSGRCRRCGCQLGNQEPVTVPRPVLGVLRLSTGDEVALDRSVLLGRNPKSDVDGPERPHLVKLNSTGTGDVSRNHVSVQLDGWHVIVRDLKSTNGTLVKLPGEAPQRLRPEDPMPITYGTEVTLADGVSFVFEVER